MGVGVLLAKLGVAGAILASLWPLWRLRRIVAGTTLTTAWNWALGAWCVWAALWIVTAFVAVPFSGPLWYVAAVLAICPPLAALGAKRPMSRAWSVFVILPAILALGWSALASLWEHRANPQSWQLESPVTVGYVLVLVMTVGNYLATRFAIPAAMSAAAVVLIVLPVSSWTPWQSDFATEAARGAASLLMVAVLFISCALSQHAWPGTSPIDRVWNEFRNLFGVVWARRIQERMRAAAEEHRWTVVLEWNGFEPRSSPIPPVANADLSVAQAASSPSTKPVSPEQALRWLLRRFVDDAWLEIRLGRASLLPVLPAESVQTLSTE